MAFSITASMLYNWVQCPHRVLLDQFEEPSKRDTTSKFVELLWERGTAFEIAVIKNLKQPFTDLSGFSSEERELLTNTAMQRGDPMIYKGRITSGNMIGEPDLLRRIGDRYIAGDIKSGSGEEGANDFEEGKPKRHYAVQLAFYTDILERNKISFGRNPFVWDIHGAEVIYNLNEPRGPKTSKTLWQDYKDVLEDVSRILDRTNSTSSAMSSICKLCHWHTICRKFVEEANDLTLIPELGRSKRDIMIQHVRTVRDFAEIDLSQFLIGKKTIFPGIGAEVLGRLQERARMQIHPETKPYLLESVELGNEPVELFFDIETDPMRDICYLHGFLERRDRNAKTVRYSSFFADTPSQEAEKHCFAEAVDYIRRMQPCVIYFYSKYERTWWRKLQLRYPSVIEVDYLETLFGTPIGLDLYFDVIHSKTMWPTRDHSIKTLASYLGFKWRDMSPSGAESIEWYERWVETGDDSIRQRILDYNEDDCAATMVLLDGLRAMPVDRPMRS